MLLLQAHPSLDNTARRGLREFQIMSTRIEAEEPNFIKGLEVRFTARYIGMAG